MHLTQGATILCMLKLPPRVPRHGWSRKTFGLLLHWLLYAVALACLVLLYLLWRGHVCWLMDAPTGTYIAMLGCFAAVLAVANGPQDHWGRAAAIVVVFFMLFMEVRILQKDKRDQLTKYQKITESFSAEKTILSQNTGLL